MTGRRAAVDVRITGRVQGVSFRAGCADRAARLAVAGWAANEPDGSVTGHFEGAPDDVAALLAWCREGTPQAQVEAVSVTDAEDTGASGFVSR